MIVGIDIGGTNTKIGILDSSLTLVSTKVMETLSVDDIHVFLKSLMDSIHEMINSQNISSLEISGIGIGMPGLNSETGRIEAAANFPWNNISISDALDTISAWPYALINDANAAALAEKNFGSAKDSDNFLVVTLGTGLGSGLVLNGDLVMGKRNGVELGHVTAIQDGRKCGCGRYGCLETYVSATGLKRTAFEMLCRYNGDEQFNHTPFSEISSKDIFRANENGNQIAKKALQYTGEVLGNEIAKVVAFLDLEKVILAGGLANSGEVLITATRDSVNSNLNGFNECQVTITELPSDQIGVLGAAAAFSIMDRNEIKNSQK